MSRTFVPMVGTVTEVADETADIRTMRITLDTEEKMVALPGQFIEFTIFGYGEFPVSISGMDNEGHWIQATIQEKGRVTRHVSSIKVGDSVGIRGPFGNGYPLELLTGKNVYIVSGGMGLAAVWLLIESIVRERQKYGEVAVLYGARCMADMIYKDSFLFDNERASGLGIKVATTVDLADSCWDGNVGLVTSLFDKIGVDPTNACAVICGPEIMITASCSDLTERGFNGDYLILSMERRMQCGVGMCGHCMIGEKRVCADGPIFKYSEVRDSLTRHL